MTVDVNGTPRDVPDGLSLAELIAEIAGSLRGSAAVVDDEVVPRGEWADYRLSGGQRVEIITAVQGG